MAPPPPSKRIDYGEFVEIYGNHIPKDWPIEIRAGKIVIPKEHDGVSLRTAILEEKFPGNWLERKINWIADKVDPYKFVTKSIHQLDAIVAQTNRECAKIMGVPRPKDGPTLLLAEPGPNDSFTDRLRYKILSLQLEQAGATVETPKAYRHIENDREVWVRDRYVLAPDGTAVFHGETSGSHNNTTLKTLQQEFKDRKLPFKQINTHIEGGDVLQHPQTNTVFIGISANEKGMDPARLAEAKLLAKTLGMKLKPIPRVDGNYYHLDTMMSVLPDGSIMVMPGTTNKQGMDAIYATVDKKDVLELKIPQRQGFSLSASLNLITVNRHVFTPHLLPEMEKFLRARGFYPHEGLYETMDAGPHCRVNVLQRRAPDGKSDVALKELDMHGLSKLPWAIAEAGQDRTQPTLVVHNKNIGNPSLG